MIDNIHELPADLPVPLDDGACDHLRGMTVPPIPLPSTAGGSIDLAGLDGRTVVYCYPRTGEANQDPPVGWNEIPGARGCTPQSCAFRDHFRELQAVGARVSGLSTQSTEYQQEAVRRLHLPFALLSDQSLTLARALRLPTFEVEVLGTTLIKRLTLLVHSGRIEQVWYPVFPPSRNAEDVLAWLREHPIDQKERV